MHGLSTLNRLLGKKNKEVSRSTSNLNKINSLDTSSQHNKISPIVNNAPFEQTFRVTIFLPKNQLYVERIGAKTKLKKLMDDVCDSKCLNADKYEFRHPTDLSQTFDNEKTIGEVGYNELRLVLKTESRINSDFQRFNADDVMKYKTDSITSSEISRNMRNASKTSPYSSTNSLNSLDSTGMNSTGKTQAPVAPIRKKKRAAPRPPSQNSIPEQEIFSSSTLNVFKEPHSILPRKNFHVSSPQLYNNGNKGEKIEKSDRNNNNVEMSLSNRLNAITRPSSLYVTEIDQNKPERPERAERHRNHSESSEIQNILKDGESKQNSLEKRKKSPAPVPPVRRRPLPSPRTVQDESKATDSVISEIKEIDEQENANAESVKEFQHIESEGPVSIQINSTAEKTTESNVKENVKLPVISKVHISNDEETRSSSCSEEEEMTVNIYNVTKSVVTCEKPSSKESRHNLDNGTSKTHFVSEEIIVTTVVEERQRSPSPLWTYTLPAPPVLNDSIGIDKSSPTDRIKSNDKFFSDFTSNIDNETVLSDSNTTVLSTETHIQPIIQEREKSLSKIISGEIIEKNPEAITSDVEDGYLGNEKENSQLIQNTCVEKEIIIENLQRSRLIITRSDSFHSIGPQKINNEEFKQKKSSALPQRSTSFLSLVNSHKMEVAPNKQSNENVPYSKQKSTSELSISDVPSLSSLEVIKSILNSSRKNSLQETPSVTPEVIKEKVSLQESVSYINNSNEVPESQSTVTHDTKVVRQLETQKSEPVVENEKVKTQWRYSGPPKINFTTWNERPKVEVSVMNDGDYKYGGSGGGSNLLPREPKKITVNERPEIAPKKFDIKNDSESGIKHLPKVLGVEYKKDMSPVVLRQSNNQQPSKTIINIKPRPVTMDYSTISTSEVVKSKNITTNYQNASTQFVSYNRLNTSNKKFTPIVHGFKLDNINETTQADTKLSPITANKPLPEENGKSKKAETPVVPAKPNYLRSKSSGDVNRGVMKFSTVTYGNENNNNAYEESPFAQSLRKTGLIEKMLTNDKSTESIFGRVIDKPQESKAPENIVVLHFKKSNSVPEPPPPPPPTTSSTSQTYRKSAPVGDCVDSRNQLLDEIKNFNMNSLRRK